MNIEDRVTKEYVENAIANAGTKIATGTYTGNWYNNSSVSDPGQTITLGFRPKAVLIFPNFEAYDSAYYHTAMSFDGSPNNSVEITNSGFTVKWNTNLAYRDDVSSARCNPYRYIAFG